jgi:uncharacterized protein YjbI with pentapeptide repeats
MSCHTGKSFGSWCKDYELVHIDRDGREYCAFHAPQGQKAISEQEFEILITNRINTYISKQATCDLSGTIFEYDFIFSPIIRSQITVKFSSATFEQTADFSGIEIEGKLDFTNVAFNDDANFSGSSMLNEIDFTASCFESAALFKNTLFEKNAVFKSSIFMKTIDFSRSTFNDIDFADVIFNGPVNFQHATFKSKGIFQGKTFSDTAQFNGSDIYGKLRLENVDLRKVSFVGSDLRNVDFINCTFLSIKGRKLLYDEVLLNRLKSKNEESITEVEILYRRLKQKNKEEHNEFEVSNWHYGEKTLQRQKTSIQKFFNFIVLNAYWISSGYGERPLRALGVLFLIFLLLSLLLAYSGLAAFEDMNKNSRLLRYSHGINKINLDGTAIDFTKAVALFLTAAKYATFQRDVFFEPSTWLGECIKFIIQLLLPLQTAFFAIALRNRFRR